MPTRQTDVAVDAFVEQAEELCTLHDHITRVIAALDVSEGPFSDQYGRTSMTDFKLSMLCGCSSTSTRAGPTTANSTAG